MPHAAPASKRRRLIRLLLWGLGLAGLALCMWQTAQVAREQALQSLRQDAENELRLSAAGLTGHLSRHDYLPELLASREAVKRFLASPDSQDPMPLNRLLDRFRATADVSDIYLLDHHADTLAASNWHRPDTFIGQNYRYRRYYQEAIAGRNGRFFGLGVQSGERGYYFSAPVWLDETAPDARPDGVMVLKVLLNAVEDSWAEQDAELLVTGRDGVIFLASQPALRLTAMKPLGEAQRVALRASRRYGDEPLPPSGLREIEHRDERTRLVGFAQGPLAGQPYFSLTRPMPAFDWHMHILKPLTPVISAQWVSALLAGGLYGLVALGGGIGWQRLRLRRERERFAERERRTLARARDELERNVANRTRDLVATNRRLSDEIEERRRAEQSLRETRDELVQAAKLAVLGQLAAGINHELNQPLAAIRAYAENARAFIARSRAEAADANLGQIVELTGRMAEISAQLRQFSRKSGDTLTAVSVQSCFDYALRLFQARLSEGAIHIERRWPEQTAWVRADPVRLEQVLVNLIGNALQALAETSSPHLTLAIETTSERVSIEVADNGPGIPEDHLARIFEPFFTTKSTGSGLGLGLSISGRIIDDLGGRLEARNAPGGGARFTITLPRDSGPDGKRAQAKEQSHHA
ncbi:sensor histidine kinase [Halomonas stenophila]|uniref:C4-dicarboxylate transport sensor protein DctB n=1 Tax=Halomonas stenophila TaxID=795312 RepID=A0A7W5ESY4_9GAMM|nr:ATP-binding protein [Halomonas stenophila]MBB3230864.1 two-component system C4-dicarboxylate transport sensor histidine kinase DctB [Halomonas stenophila]